MQLTGQHKADFADQGYILVRNALTIEDFAQFEKAFVRVTEEKSGRCFSGLHDPEMVKYFQDHMDVESAVYNDIRRTPEIRQMATGAKLVGLLKQLDDSEWGLLEKMILRIDLPLMEKEVAHWHQDFFYVKGNDRILTFWIPLQKTTQENGCLLVQPGSHKMGAVSHDETVGKRHLPNEAVRRKFSTVAVPMEFGDVLIFHSYLLHSGQLNTSQSTRYSFQFRYTPQGLPTDPGMGNVLCLS